MDIFVGSYSLSSISLDSASVASVEDDGGYQIDLRGVFRAEPVSISLINTLTSDRYACYGARSGEGYAALPKSASLISLATPPMPTGTYAFQIAQGAYTAVSTSAAVPFTLAVVRRQWKTKVHALRRVFPAWYKLGPRSLDNVELLT